MILDNDNNAEETVETHHHPKSIQRRKNLIQSTLLPSLLSTRNLNHFYFLKISIRSCRRGVPEFGGLIYVPSLSNNKENLAKLMEDNGIEEKRGIYDEHT